MAPQSGSLFLCQLKHEIGRKTFTIAKDCTIQGLGFNTVEDSQIGIQQDPVPAQGKNGSLDAFNRNKYLFSHV